MRGCGAEISKTVSERVSGRQAEAHAVSPEPRPTTATSCGASWTVAGMAPSSVWPLPYGIQLLPLPLTDNRQPPSSGVSATTLVASSSKNTSGTFASTPWSLRQSAFGPGSSTASATSASAGSAKPRP